MSRVLLRYIVVAVMFVGVALFTSSLFADELTDVVTDLANAGVSEDAIGSILSGPSTTLGQRVNQMLKNGTITQRQYNTIYNKLINLPTEKIQAIKNAYDNDPSKVSGLVRRIAGKKLDINDDASLRDHIKDLKQQGFTKEQIQARLKNEGVSADKLKDLGYGSVGSMRDHAKDIGQDAETRQRAKDRRDMKAVDRQGRTDKGKAWWKFWEQDDKRDKVKDKAQDRPGVFPGGKQTRDTRKDVRQQESETRRGRR